MADYSLPEYAEKRVRYFDGQFLQDTDFIDEQNYQRDREHRINRLLHGPGVANGLTVTSPAPNQVTVAPGTAIDEDGYQLVLADATKVDLPGGDFNGRQGVRLYISYLQTPVDPQTVGGSEDYTRWLERPELTALAPGQEYSSTAPPVLLATLGLDDAGRVTIDNTVRVYSGLRMPGSGADAVTMRATSAGPARLAGSLTIDGSVGVGTSNPRAKLEVAGGGGASIDLLVNGRLRSDNDDGGLWVSDDRFIGGFGTSKIGVWNGTAWRLAVLSNGNIGIGTHDPEGSLHITAAPSSAPIRALQLDVQSFQSTENALASSFLSVRDLSDGGTVHFLIRGDGNVGVGTANPRAKVEVAGGGGASVDLLVNGRLRSDNDDGGLWVSGDRFIGGFGTSKIGVWSGTAWRLAVLSNGNVGIGSTDPVNDLEIGNYENQDRYLAFKIGTGLSYRSGLKMWAGQENYGYSIQYDERLATGRGLHVKTHYGDANAVEGTSRLYIGWDGKVGVGTTKPAGNLHVDVAESEWPIQAVQIDVQSFTTTENARESAFLSMRDTAAGNTVFTVRGDGSVGIGTADTQRQRLLVSGPTWLRGDLFVGGPGNSGRLIYWWGGDHTWRMIQNRANDFAGSYAITDGSTPSDVRLKSDLRPLSGALDLVRKLRGVRYRWGKDGLSHFTRDVESGVSAGPDATDEQERQVREEARAKALAALAGDRIGLVAQDVEKVLPELIHADEDGYKHIRYQHLTALLTEAIKEQDAALRTLSAEVAALRAGQ